MSHFSIFCDVLFVVLSLQDQDIQAFGLAKHRADNPSGQTLLPPSMSQYLHYSDECQTSHEIKLFQPCRVKDTFKHLYTVDMPHMKLALVKSHNFVCEDIF